jgi:hypothetical protein
VNIASPEQPMPPKFEVDDVAAYLEVTCYMPFNMSLTHFILFKRT